MIIAVDAMGTDNYPAPDVAGAVLAAQEFGDPIILVGDESIIRQELEKHNATNLPIEIVHAPEAISMSDKPSVVGKSKPNSSMHIGMRLVKEGKAHAFVSAGNTGAAMAVATLHSLGRIRGVKRPALTAVGELMGNTIVVVDVGANTDTKLEWLTQFAIMGNYYAEKVLEKKNPRVGLLANGEEEGKGDQLVRDAGDAFKKLPLNFIGNVEPKDLLSGRVDVIVTDGYVGNILLKTYEAAISSVFRSLKQELTQDLRGKLGGLLAKPYLKKVVKQLDASQYGGAPLLGIDGIVIITHGGSDAQVIRNSIVQARKAVDANLIETIKNGIGENQP